jgi:hypothetical protein
MVVPDIEDECCCYEAFYNVTLNDALVLKICPVCAGEKMKRKGDEMFLLSNPSIMGLLTCSWGSRPEEKRIIILGGLLEIDEKGVACWMCFNCLRSLEQGILPKGALANDFWIGEISPQLTGLTILEQLLIAHYYP